MELTQLENDLLGDLHQDSHGSWEIFEFVRLHHPAASDDEVFTIGRQLYATWTKRGWLTIHETSSLKSEIETMAQFLDHIDRMGTTATRVHERAALIDLTDKAHKDVPWLQKR